MNYDETDIDCGGPLCPSCELGEVREVLISTMLVLSTCTHVQVCSANDDCGTAVCLGVYVHPTELSYPFDVQLNNTCGQF